jgi:hypothetical protein
MRKVGLEVSIVYRKEYRSLCCRMILGHPPPQASVSELYKEGVERQRGGSHFALEREWGDPIHIRQDRNSGTPYSTYTPFKNVEKVFLYIRNLKGMGCIAMQYMGEFSQGNA